MREDLKKQGVDMDTVMANMMGDPEMQTLMSKPHVQKVMMDAQRNPASLAKHMADPDVRKLIGKMRESAGM